jgi:hypothetical protein
LPAPVERLRVLAQGGQTGTGGTGR